MCSTFADNGESQPLVERETSGIYLQHLKHHRFPFETGIINNTCHTRGTDSPPLVLRENKELINLKHVRSTRRCQETDIYLTEADNANIL